MAEVKLKARKSTNPAAAETLKEITSTDWTGSKRALDVFVVNQSSSSSSSSQEKILGQLQPGSIATTIYTVPVGTTTIVRTIIICNPTVSDETYRIFIDDDGSTYDATTAIFFDAPVAAKETKLVDTSLGMATVGGTVGVQSSGASVNFTVSGAEILL
jgi:hypothetical protein